MRYGKYVTNSEGKRVFKDDINVELALIILELLTNGAQLTARSISASVGHLGSKLLQSKLNDQPRLIPTKIGNMRRSKLLETIETIDGIHYQISEEGIAKLQELSLKKLRTDVWDEKWRILSYDIPESKRLARDAIRRLINDLGMKQIHRSVWVTPYDCSEQIKALKSIYKIEDDLLFVVTNEIDQEQRIRKIFFGLTSKHHDRSIQT